MGKSHDFPFNIMDVAELLHLRIRRPHATGYYTDCPICGDKRGKMSLSTELDSWRCNYCGEHVGMLGYIPDERTGSRSSRGNGHKPRG